MDDAINDCNQSIQLNPKEVKAYYSRGFIYTKKGEKANAIADFKKVLELCDNDFILTQIATKQLEILDATGVYESTAYDGFCDALNKLKPGWEITEKGITGPGGALVRLAQHHASFSEGHFDVQFVFDEDAAPGLEFWDCISGLGHSVADKARNAAYVWSVTTACTYFELKYSWRGEFADHYHGYESGAFWGWHVIRGAAIGIGHEDSRNRLQQWWVENSVIPVVSDAVNNSLDEQRPHGIKILFGGDDVAEVRVDGEVHEAASEVLKNLPWPRLKPVGFLRTYILVLHREVKPDNAIAELKKPTTYKVIPHNVPYIY